jgi:hypothetical protein
MTRGISLHVGVNFTAFGATPLLGCVNDANAMAMIAQEYGFEGREVLADSEALLEVVMEKIRIAATQLERGDIFLFTFSGHGSYFESDSDEGGAESDWRDEALVFHDYMLSDDVIALSLLPRFAAGVRFLMVADSCFSGSLINRTAPEKDHRIDRDAVAENRKISLAKFNDRLVREVKSETRKMISETDRIRHLERNRLFYQKMFRDLPEDAPVKASVLQIGACEDFETAADGLPNSAFTHALLTVMGSRPPASYTELVADVDALLPQQTPKLTHFPELNTTFAAQAPFTI